MRTLAVINQKGGCGKTTTAINLAATFADLGRRTLLVDMDPQGHCALGLAVPENQLEATICEALLADSADGFEPDDALWQISDKLDLLPSHVALATVEQRLSGAPDRDRRLSRVLDRVGPTYELCVIDCPPNIGLLTFNALRAADEVIVPVEAGYFALAGAVKQAATLQTVADRVGHPLRLHVLPTMYDVRTKMARQIVNELRKHFGRRCLSTPIHLSSKLREAASYGQPINEYDPASRGAQDFERLARHLLAMRPEPMARAPRVNVEALTPVLAGVGEEAAERGPQPLPQPRSRPVAVAAPDRGRGQASPMTAGGPAGGGAPANNRAAELVQRARALSERTAQLQRRLDARPQAPGHDFRPQAGRLEVHVPPQPRPAGDAQPRRSLEHKLRDFYGVRVTHQGTLFIQPQRRAQSICVAGDFNDWSPVATPMRRDARLGVWQACIDLPPGRYRYRLIVDGQWVADPHNRRVETNPFGELNNIIEVQ